MRIIKCAVCGKDFEAYYAKEKYCCPDCRVAGDRIRRMKWNELHPDYNRQRYLRIRNQNKRNEGSIN